MAKQNIQLQTVLNEPSQAALDLPFYNDLPKDKVGLYKWRIYVLSRCMIDAEFREDIKEMCRQDIVFFAATFVWLHETRDGEFAETIGKFPFMPWTDQVDVMAWLQEYAGKTDITIEKTRGIGLSWVAVTFLMWKWLFYGETMDYGILSKDELSLDMLNRPATLMGKMDVLFKMLPGWLQLGANSKTILRRTSSSKHQLIHTESENAILGYASTDDKLRSARFNIVVTDEAAFLDVDFQRWMASSQHTSPSRIFISTHDGTATMFYRMTQDSKSKLVRISTWWQANPARWKGAYVVKGGIVHILDKTYKFPVDYEFCHDTPGLERSVWLDSEFNRPGADKVGLMQEIYGTAAIDMKKLMQRDVLEIATRSATPPLYRCRLNSYDEFIEDLEGDWHFWQEPALPFTGSYIVGVDPAIGVADKALAGVCAIDVVTGAVVATAGLASCDAVQLAGAVKVLCELLCGARGMGHAQVAYESQGIGVSFLTELRRLRWPSIFKENKKFGIPNKDKGEKLLIEAGRAIRDGEFVISDARVVDDFSHFEYNSKVELVFTGDQGHGDIGQAAALAWWAGRKRRRAILETENPPSNENKQPIELEANYRSGQKKPCWSDRFAQR